jgi:hypothetical protein
MLLQNSLPRHWIEVNCQIHTSAFLDAEEKTKFFVLCRETTLALQLKDYRL